MATRRDPSGGPRRRRRTGSSGWRLAALAICLAPLLQLASGGTDAAAAEVGPVGSLELFVHPAHGGGWAARPLGVALVAEGSPSLGAGHGELVVAQRAVTGDVVVAVGALAGGFTTTDLTATAGAPLAAGRPAVAVAARGAVSVWYRTGTGDLVVATSTSRTTPWSVTDVTALVQGEAIEGDPTAVATTTSSVAYAVTEGGAVVEAEDPTGTVTGWELSDPTKGLVAPPLTGALDVLAAPGEPSATVLVGATPGGDVVELSDEVAGPDVGAWRATDLTATESVPGASAPLAGASALVPVVAYRAWSGDVESLSLTTGLPGGVIARDLTATTGLDASQGAQPTVTSTPSGPAVAVRAAAGDLLVAPVATTATATDVSFQPHTAELVGADAAAALDGSADVLVAADGGPIAPTPLLRRIVLLATSFDQAHRGFVTTPAGSDCNPFTATFGRGVTAGCPRGSAAEAWCSDFAQWVWQTAGVPTAGISGWSASFVTWGVKHHRVQLGTRFTPAVGDAIVWGQRTPLYGTHVALIVAVDGPDVEIVSGNASGAQPGSVGVWRSGSFDAATSTVNGYRVLGVVRP